MNIDFFTFAAQILNLIILLFLLRKFLYVPVLKAVDERQKFIEQELLRAENAHKKALKLEQQCQQRMAEIEEQKQDVLLKTHNEAAELAVRLSAEAQRQFEAAKVQWKNRLKAEQRTFELAVQNLIIDHFKTFATDALKQMADISLNDLVVEKLQEKIKALSARKKEEFATAYQRQTEINVQSAQKLKAENQQELKIFLTQQFVLPDGIKFRFTVNPELVCGVAVQAQEQLISWNLAAYLEDFQKNMDNEVSQLVNRG